MSPGLMTLIAWLTTTVSLAPIQDVPSPVGVRPAFPGQPARTESELRAVLETKPSDLTPYLELAHLYHRAGRTEEADQVLRRALGVHSQTGAVYAAMLTLYGGPDNLDHRDKIAEIAEEWIKAEPTNPKPLLLLGQVHLDRAMKAREQQQDASTHLDRASQVLDDAFRLQPDDFMTRRLRLVLARLRLDGTDDPAERERLEREIAKGTWASSRMAQMEASASSAKTGSPPSTSQFPNAVRVGGNIKLPAKIKDVKPVYPADAMQAGVQGVVIFEVVIDEAGKVAEARVLRSIQLLAQAAEEAVRQWEFTPTLLNGSPVPVIMTVTVQFTLPPQ